VYNGEVMAGCRYLFRQRKQTKGARAGKPIKEVVRLYTHKTRLKTVDMLVFRAVNPDGSVSTAQQRMPVTVFRMKTIEEVGVHS
jgi:hypothetical protein